MTLYKGRIQESYSELMDAINRSLPVDIRLLPYDVKTNRAWAGELSRLGILSAGEHESILAALDELLAQAADGAFGPLPEDEDVHTLVERILTEKLGDTGAKIHAGRSRNDQVVCDLRMFTADKLAELTFAMIELVRVLKDLAKQHAETMLSGTTHMQPAQPITLGFFLLSLAFALIRDIERAGGAFARTNQCPLGAGALAGSGFAVDRKKLAETLGFEGVCDNAMDAISDRDFVQEVGSVCALVCTHLSRYAEQFILWANPAFGYIRFSDQWSTGSSMMPQKRNPDPMELIRGKAAVCIGNAAGLMALTKGVPLSYAKDLQEDKKLVFDSLDTALICVQVFGEAVAVAAFDPERMKQGLSGDMLATDLADVLVEAGVPFRRAHDLVAKFVTELEEQSQTLLDVGKEQLEARFPQLSGSEVSLDYESSLSRRSLIGGTAPDSVRAQIDILEEFLDGFNQD